MPTVLHVFDHSAPIQSGYSSRSLSILREQKKLGWNTYQVTSPKHMLWSQGSETTEMAGGIEFIRAKAPPSLLSAIPLVGELAVVNELQRTIRSIARDVRPDVIHAHSPALNGLAALLALREYSIPLVYECRAFWEDAAVDHGTAKEWGARYRATRMLETFVANRASAVLPICNQLMRDFEVRGIDRSKMFVVPNGVDLQQWDGESRRDEVRSRLGLRDKEVIGFAGSFYEYEGLDFLLRAAKKLSQSRPNLRVLLVGGGPAEDALRREVAGLGIDELTLMPGRVAAEQVPGIYDCIDVCAFPRKSMRLTNLVTPLKPLEALARAKPVIASDVGGHKELISHGETGLLFQAGNLESFVEAVAVMLDDRAYAESLGESGRKYVAKFHDWSTIGSVYRAAYQAVGLRNF